MHMVWMSRGLSVYANTFSQSVSGWSLALMAQRMSVALHLAVAWEIAASSSKCRGWRTRRRSFRRRRPRRLLRHTPYRMRWSPCAVWVPLGKTACELGSYSWRNVCGSYDVTNKCIWRTLRVQKTWRMHSSSAPARHSQRLTSSSLQPLKFRLARS